MKDAAKATVNKEDGTSTTATVKYRSTDVDLAVLSADAFQVLIYSGFILTFRMG